MATDFAAVARLLANQSRAAMVDRLMDGSVASAGELARVAGVTASTASEHLSELEVGGLVSSTTRGRCKYFSISTADVATALERLSLICPAQEVRSLKQSRNAAAMARFRTCYDHLAGSIAVALCDELARRQWTTRRGDSILLSRRGEVGLADLGVDFEWARAQRRTFLRTCVDWSEKRPHLAGAVGADIARLFLEQGWARRRPGGRGLDITTSGRQALSERFSVQV